MTIEELFAEEYKNLKAENEELKSRLEESRQDLNDEIDRNLEFCSFMWSLKLQIKKSDYNGKNYISFGNAVICEGDKSYELASEFAKEDEPKEEDEK